MISSCLKAIFNIFAINFGFAAFLNRVELKNLCLTTDLMTGLRNLINNDFIASILGCRKKTSIITINLKHSYLPDR